MDGPNVPMEIVNWSACHLRVPLEHHGASLGKLIGEGDISQGTRDCPLLYVVGTGIANIRAP